MKVIHICILFSLLVTSYLSFANSHKYDVNKRLAELGISLKTPSAPVANYVLAVTTGNLVFTAGHGPMQPDGKYVIGKVGKDLSVQEGAEAARLTGIALLSSLQQEIGDLNRIKRIVKVMGMVNATEDFTQHSTVINGFSDLMVEVFGENGKHARSAVGVASLPVGFAVEIEMIVELKTQQ
jgi:enamine deaminase RidA (YjgF/YER057c/UK114 family)